MKQVKHSSEKKKEFLPKEQGKAQITFTFAPI